MSQLAADRQEEAHHVWDEITDFEVGQTDAARKHLQNRLCQMVGAWNSTWGGALHLDTSPTCHDPLQGWRVALTQVLHPFEAPAENGPFKELQDNWNNREIDASFLLPMRAIGTFRTYGLRRDMPEDWFNGAVYQNHFARYGTVDAIWIGFPLNCDAESHFGFYSHRVFTAEDIASLAYALRGIKWFHRQLMLTSGPLIARTPLTPTERKVLRLLLTKASEKVIANQLDMAASTTHQHVVSLFRKFSVHSRAELMSLWLSHPG